MYLVGDKLVIDAIFLHEFIVCAYFMRHSVFKAHNQVGCPYRGKAMSNHQCSATLASLVAEIGSVILEINVMRLVFVIRNNGQY